MERNEVPQVIVNVNPEVNVQVQTQGTQGKVRQDNDQVDQGNAKANQE